MIEAGILVIVEPVALTKQQITPYCVGRILLKNTMGWTNVEK